MVNNNIQLTDSDLRSASMKGMDAFLTLFTDAYLNMVGEEMDVSKMDLLNGYQHTLLGYRFFRGEVMEGGFCQLIQNGYAPYIFDNPFAKSMRLMGLKDFSKLIYRAKEIYDAHKEDLVRERTDEEFMAMYEQYEAFDDLEDEFIENEEEITATLARYVDENISQFAQVVVLK